MRDRSDNFIQQEKSGDDLEALQDAMAEAEDISADFAIDMHKGTHQAATEAERFSKEIGE